MDIIVKNSFISFLNFLTFGDTFSIYNLSFFKRPRDRITREISKKMCKNFFVRTKMCRILVGRSIFGLHFAIILESVGEGLKRSEGSSIFLFEICEEIHESFRAFVSSFFVIHFGDSVRVDFSKFLKNIFCAFFCFCFFVREGGGGYNKKMVFIFFFFFNISNFLFKFFEFFF